MKLIHTFLFLALGISLSMPAQAILCAKSSSSEIEKVKMQWLAEEVSVDFSELKKLYSLPRFLAVRRLEKKHGIKVLLKDGVTSFQEFSRTPMGHKSSSIYQYFVSSLAENKRNIAAIKFYTEKDDFDKYHGLYIPAFFPIITETEAFRAEERPFGNRPIIFLGEGFMKAALLHELLHHQIAKNHPLKEGVAPVESTPRLKIFADYYRTSNDLIEAMDKSDNTNFARSGLAQTRIVIKMIELKYKEELAINQFLLEHKDVFNISPSDQANLLHRYQLDLELYEKELNQSLNSLLQLLAGLDGEKHLIPGSLRELKIAINRLHNERKRKSKLFLDNFSFLN